MYLKYRESHLLHHVYVAKRTGHRFCMIPETEFADEMAVLVEKGFVAPQGADERGCTYWLITDAGWNHYEEWEKQW